MQSGIIYRAHSMYWDSLSYQAMESLIRLLPEEQYDHSLQCLSPIRLLPKYPLTLSNRFYQVHGRKSSDGQWI